MLQVQTPFWNLASMAMGLGACLLAGDALAKDPEWDAKPWPPKLTYSNGDFKVTTNGRFRGDAVWINDDVKDHQDGLDVRQFRLGLSGNLAADTRFRMEADFADEQMVTTYLFLEQDWNDHWRGRIGYFKEPFGMERLNSSGAGFFPERASMAALTPGRNTGIMLTRFSDNWSVAGGVFTQMIEPTASETNWSMTGRATYAPPLSEDDRLRAHLGIAGSVRKMESVRFSAVPDTDITPAAAIDSTRLRDTDYVMQLGLEGAFAVDSVLMQAEYVRASIDQKIAEDLTYDGWYAQIGWAITGERRAYSPAKDAVFMKLQPNQEFEWNGDGWGAWEVALRYSTLNLNDGITPRGEQDSVTAGISWFPTANWRLTASVSQVMTDAYATTPNDDPLVTGLRLQFEF